MTVRQAFTIPVGSMTLTVPSGASAVPGLMWGNLALAGLMESYGYDEAARETLDKLEGWLRTPLEDLAWPGEQAKRLGRKLSEDARPTDALLRWYVVRAATRQQTRAEESLIEAGLVVYLPRLTRWRRHAGRKHKIEMPLLGGYLFAGARAEREACNEDQQRILGAEGVHCIVKFNQDRAPLAIPFGDILRICTQERDGEFDRTGKRRKKDPASGSTIKVTGGPFQGFPARFIERTEDDRVRVLLKMFGKDTPHLMKSDHLDGLDTDI